MKISIVTVCRDSEKYLADTIDSVLRQKYSDVEYIIIDGASTDGSLEIIRSRAPLFQGRLKWVSEPDGGIYDAINKGIAMASGEVIGVLHSDDIFAFDEVLDEVFTAFRTSGADVVYGDLCYVKPDDVTRVRRYWKSMPFRPSMLHWGWMPAHPTVFMKRAVYEQHGAFDIALSTSADYDYMVRVFSHPSYSFHYLNKLVTLMRTGGRSNGSLRKKIRKSKEDWMVLRKHQMPHPIRTLVSKNVRKVPQFVLRIFKSGKL